MNTIHWDKSLYLITGVLDGKEVACWRFATLRLASDAFLILKDIQTSSVDAAFKLIYPILKKDS